MLRRVPIALALLAAPALVQAECPVKLEGSKGPIKGRQFTSWAAMHQAVTGKPAASEAAARKTLCAGQEQCGGDRKVHVIDPDLAGAALVLQGQFEVPAGAPYYMLFTKLEDAFEAYETRIDWTITPLDAGKAWVAVHGEAEILGRQPMCDDPEEDCPTATVITGYELIDLAFHNESFAFGAACMSEEGERKPTTSIKAADGRFGYRGCDQTRHRWFTIPLKGGCAPVLPTLANPKATLKAGRAAAARKDWAAALAAFDQLVDSAPTHAAWRAERGFVRHKAGKPFAAERDFRKALEHTKVGKTRGMTLYNLGLALEAQGRLSEALTAFTESEQARPHPAARKRITALKAKLAN